MYNYYTERETETESERGRESVCVCVYASKRERGIEPMGGREYSTGQLWCVDLTSDERQDGMGVAEINNVCPRDKNLVCLINVAS